MTVLEQPSALTLLPTFQLGIPAAIYRDHLASAFRILPPSDQLLLSMLYLEELTVAETALVLDMTVADVLAQHAVTLTIIRGWLKSPRV